jgi:hypothetical protein
MINIVFDPEKHLEDLIESQSKPITPHTLSIKALAYIKKGIFNNFIIKYKHVGTMSDITEIDNKVIAELKMCLTPTVISTTRGGINIPATYPNNPYTLTNDNKLSVVYQQDAEFQPK